MSLRSNRRERKLFDDDFIFDAGCARSRGENVITSRATAHRFSVDRGFSIVNACFGLEITPAATFINIIE